MNRMWYRVYVVVPEGNIDFFMQDFFPSVKNYNCGIKTLFGT